MNVLVIGMFVHHNLHVETYLACTPAIVLQDLNGKMMNVTVGCLMAVYVIHL